jgi:glycosyltransferase involved in cell wall biosynthesis
MHARGSGTTKFSYARLFSFALDGLMSFSAIPLKVWTYVGLLASTFALAMAAYFWLRTLVFGVDVPGYASLIVSIAFFSGVQLISLGVLGEYIARIFDEVKGRPLYIIAERIGEPDPAKPHGAESPPP